MSLRRTITWSSAQHDLRKDRAAAPAPAENPMFLASMARAKAMTARKEALAAPLVVAGRFDRSAIMKAALATARAERARGVSLPFSSSCRPRSAAPGRAPSHNPDRRSLHEDPTTLSQRYVSPDPSRAAAPAASLCTAGSGPTRRPASSASRSSRGSSRSARSAAICSTPMGRRWQRCTQRSPRWEVPRDGRHRVSRRRPSGAARRRVLPRSRRDLQGARSLLARHGRRRPPPRREEAP